MVRVQVPCLEGASRKAPETATEAGEEGRKEMLYEGVEEEAVGGGRGDTTRWYGCRFLVACMLSLSDLCIVASPGGGGKVREAKSGMAGRRPAKQPGRSDTKAHASVRASTWQLADRSMRTASGSCWVLVWVWVRWQVEEEGVGVGEKKEPGAGGAGVAGGDASVGTEGGASESRSMPA
jgi:hypothetical protein